MIQQTCDLCGEVVSKGAQNPPAQVQYQNIYWRRAVPTTLGSIPAPEDPDNSTAHYEIEILVATRRGAVLYDKGDGKGISRDVETCQDCLRDLVLQALGVPVSKPLPNADSTEPVRKIKRPA